MSISLLNSRCVLSIEGDDATTFLQGLITNNITKLEKQDAIYTWMLTSDGKYIYDFFIIKLKNIFYIDCDKKTKSDLMGIFNLYKLTRYVGKKER